MDARQFSLLAGFIGLLLLSGPVRATVLFVVPDQMPVVAELAVRTEEQTGARTDIRLLSMLPVADLSRYRAVVLVGPEALQAWAQPGLPAVAVFVSRDQVQAAGTRLVSAIYNEPPLLRQLALARLLLGAEQPLGILMQTPAWLERLGGSEAQLQAADAGAYFVSAAGNMNRALQALLRHSAALVAAYDPELYGAEHIKSILISSYRADRPVIGPTVSYLRAGAVASTFSDTDDVARRLGEILHSGLNNKVWPAADYNPYFDVRLNTQVGRSLNMVLPAPETLAAELQRQEQATAR